MMSPPQRGKPVRLPAATQVDVTITNDGMCMPPGNRCFSLINQAIAAGVGGPFPVAQLVFELTSPTDQPLQIQIEINGTPPSFVTKTTTFPAKQGQNLIGLNQQAIHAAGTAFGNPNATVTLRVSPDNSGVTVKVGKLIPNGKPGRVRKKKPTVKPRKGKKKVTANRKRKK